MGLPCLETRDLLGSQGASQEAVLPASCIWGGPQGWDAGTLAHPLLAPPVGRMGRAGGWAGESGPQTQGPLCAILSTWGRLGLHLASPFAVLGEGKWGTWSLQPPFWVRLGGQGGPCRLKPGSNGWFPVPESDEGLPLPPRPTCPCPALPTPHLSGVSKWVPWGGPSLDPRCPRATGVPLP